MRSFCTIITSDYLPQTLTLASSINRFDNTIPLNILVVDDSKYPVQKHAPGTIKFYHLSDIDANPYAEKIIGKYRNHPDTLRWSLKPVFLLFLLQKQNFERVIYLDSDIFFINDFRFLFDSLISNNFLLCPHWRCIRPEISSRWFEVNFTDGVFNAGFAGAAKNGIDILKYWANACFYRCEKNKRKGFFDDQKYLDLIPAHFKDVAILHHRGCNVAYWNQIENKRSLKNGEILINNTYPIIFIHFTNKLIESIEKGEDPLLKNHLTDYRNCLNEFLQ